jgi:hypothetical protein
MHAFNKLCFTAIAEQVSVSNMVKNKVILTFKHHVFYNIYRLDKSYFSISLECDSWHPMTNISVSALTWFVYLSNIESIRLNVFLRRYIIL